VEDKSIQITGDIANATSLTVFAPRSICSITWNGKEVTIESKGSGVFVAKLAGKADFVLPEITGWKYTDSLPEIQSNYSASSKAWICKSIQLQYQSMWADDSSCYEHQYVESYRPSIEQSCIVCR
jgi:hypothetical protein